MNPTKDPKSKTGFYIPENLEDCFVELEKMLDEEFIESFKNCERLIGFHHFGLGMWMRNNWGLWKGSRLNKYFETEFEIEEPDSISGIILKIFQLHLKGKEYDAKKIASPYRSFKARMKELNNKELIELGYEPEENFEKGLAKIREVLGIKVVEKVPKKTDIKNNLKKRKNVRF